jgi:beta-glucosidase
MLARFAPRSIWIPLAFCFASTLTLPIAAQDKAALAVAALNPEVQTAEWAKAWWMPRHTAKLKEKEALQQVDMIWIGDSITHGWENAGKATWDKFYARRSPFNIGFSGDRTEQVLWRLANGEVEDPAEQTAAGIEAIVKELKIKMPEAKILLLAIFPRGAAADDPLRQLNRQINERIAKLADEKQVYFQDIGSVFLDAQGNLSKELMPDLLHPNEKGYQLWAEALEPTLAKWIP